MPRRQTNPAGILPAGLKATISGFRGIIGESLTPREVCLISEAYARLVGRGRAALGRDGRPSGALLADCVRSTLCAAGLDVIDLGVVPTPTVGLAIRELRCQGGVMITASHNPPPWNGLKFYTRRGGFLGPEQFEHLMELLAEPAAFAAWDRLGRLLPPADAVGIHLEKILGFVDAARIRRRRMRVAIDGCRSAGGVILPRLCEALGCAVIAHDCEPDGAFTRPLEPTPAHLRAFSQLVRDSRAEVGFAVDPDADRLVLVAENGVCLSEELTLALAADHLLARLPGPLVANSSSSMVLDDVAERHARKVFRSPTGEAHVVEEMKRRRARIGGEGNGGVIVPDVHPGRDAAVGLAVILEGLAARGESLSRWAAALPEYCIVKRKVPVKPGAWPSIERSLRLRFGGLRVDETDGIKVIGDDSWTLIRASNTEPVVRVSAEAKDRRRASRLVKEAEAAVRGTA